MMGAAVSLAAGGASVALILILQKRVGTRAGACVAGLPVVTLPCALAVYMQSGAAQGASVFAGAVTACGVSAVVIAALSLLSQRLQERLPLFLALPATWFFCVALSGGVSALFPALPIAITFLGSLLVVFAARRVTDDAAPRIAPKPVAGAAQPSMLIATTLAFSVYALAFFSAQSLNGFWAGAIASAPTLGMIAIALGVRVQGVRAVRAGCAGYMNGLSIKLMVCAAFYLALTLSI